MPHFAQLFVAETMGARADEKAFGGNVALQRRHPAGAARLRAAQAGRAGRGRGRQLAVLRVAVLADHHLQGHADHRPAARVLPRPARRALRVGDRAGAQPVLHQHLPELAAGPPVPASSRTTARSTPSRATATGCGPARRMLADRAVRRPGRPGVRARPGPDLPGDRQRLQRLGHLRRGARAAAPVGPVAAARRADDDPGGVGEPRRDGPGPPGLLPVPRLAHGAVGRAGRGRASPTAR